MMIQNINQYFFTVCLQVLGVFTLTLAFSVHAADYPLPGNFQKGAQTWAENCGRCHNIRAANELRDDQWITTVFHMRVRAGLTGEETRDVLTFLQGSNTSVKKTQATQGAITASKLTGKEVYNQTCITCHGGGGAGSFPGVPNFTDKEGVLTKSDALLFKNIINGFQSPGSPMAMPPKGGNPDLTKEDVQKVLRYIRDEYSK